MRTLLIMRLVGLVAFAAGCSSSTPPAVPNDASTGAGDSSTDASSEDAAEAAASGPGAFVGTWTQALAFLETCPGGKTYQESLAGNVVITLGTGASSLLATQYNGCTETYAVSGSVATSTGGQPCSEATDAGVVLSVITTVTSTLTVSSDGTTLTEAATDSVSQTLPDGGTESCTATLTGPIYKQ